MNLSKYSRMSFMLPVLLLAVYLQLAAAAEPAVVSEISLDYYSKYIWRGQNLNNSDVLQPALSVSAYGFTASVWSNLDLTDKSQTAPGNSGNFSEFDFTLDYSSSIRGMDKVAYSLGVIYYRFPHTPYTPTVEVYGTVQLDLVATPFISWYRDLAEVDGSYLQAGVGHTIGKIVVINERCYCDLAAGASLGWGSAGYNRGYFGMAKDHFNDFSVSASLPFSFGAWTIELSIHYSTMLNDAIAAAVYQKDNTWLGIGLTTGY